MTSWELRRRRTKKITVCTVIFFIVLAALVLCFLLLRPYETWDLKQFYTLSFSGYDGKGSAEAVLDEEKLAEATEKKEEQYKVMCARIKYVYENGETSYFDILLNSGDITKILNRFEYVSEITKYDEKKRRELRGSKISMIFQEPMTSLNPVMKIGHQIRENILQHEKLTKAEADARVIELLKMTGLPRVERIVNEYPFQLSGGQRQRVMIAMALACKPKRKPAHPSCLLPMTSAWSRKSAMTSLSCTAAELLKKAMSMTSLPSRAIRIRKACWNPSRRSASMPKSLR